MTLWLIPFRTALLIEESVLHGENSSRMARDGDADRLRRFPQKIYTESRNSSLGTVKFNEVNPLLKLQNLFRPPEVKSHFLKILLSMTYLLSPQIFWRKKIVPVPFPDRTGKVNRLREQCGYWYLLKSKIAKMGCPKAPSWRGVRAVLEAYHRNQAFTL